MNQEIKEEWLRILRSGKYEQGKNYLRRRGPDGEKWCCLGLLCILVEKESDGALTWFAPTGKNVLYSFGKGNVRASTLPPTEVLEIAGLPPNMARMLGFLNDQGVEFAKLADLIESETFAKDLEAKFDEMWEGEENGG